MEHMENILEHFIAKQISDLPLNVIAYIGNVYCVSEKNPPLSE